MAKIFYHNITAMVFNIEDMEDVVNSMESIFDAITYTVAGNALMSHVTPEMEIEIRKALGMIQDDHKEEI